jgi:uncharacterized protein (DUF952 family)
MILIYHITPQQDWKNAQVMGSYQADSLNTEGFIHCSYEHQLEDVANRFYLDANIPLVILLIETAKIKAAVVNENLEGGLKLFPHIYGPLNLDAVVEVKDFTRGEDGLFHLK